MNPIAIRLLNQQLIVPQFDNEMGRRDANTQAITQGF